MPTKIRLQRMGKKGMPFYNIIIADGRAPRGGRFIEKIGYYNPLTKPADIHVEFDKALQWLDNGAQPTDTVRSLLKYKGVLLKKHLLGGVKKGALTQEQAEARFQAWLNEKDSKMQAQSRKQEEAERQEKKLKLEAEAKIKEERAKVLAAKRIETAREEAAAQSAETAEAVAEEPVEESPATEASAKETPAEETPAAE